MRGAGSFRARNSSIGSGTTLHSAVSSVRLQEPAGNCIILVPALNDEGQEPSWPERRTGDHTPSTATEPNEALEPGTSAETTEADASEPVSLRRQSIRATAGTPSSEPCSPWENSSATFSEHVAFRGEFSAEEASQAGFFSALKPPRVGEDVVCYQRDKWLRRGIVKRVKVRTGDGTAGLQQGAQGAWVLVKDKGAWFSTFSCYAVFLAPANHVQRTYSSVCGEGELRSSNFCTLYSAHRCADILLNSDSTPETGEVSVQDARESLQRWLDNLVDAQGHRQRVLPELKAELLRVWDDAAEDPAIHLYTRQQRLLPGNRVGARGPKGADYSLYYTALNNMLNHDTLDALQQAMPLVRRMMFSLLFHERCQEDEDSDGFDEVEPKRRFHAGGTFYKGDVDKPSPQDMWKLKEAHAQGSLVRFRQFQSTTSSRTRAIKFRHRRDTKGYEWVVEVAPGFWGARDIQDLSKVGYEAETLFPPYSAFRVLSVGDDSCHLEAVNRSQDEEWHGFLANLDTIDPARFGSRSTSAISSPRRPASRAPRRSTTSSVSSVSVTDEVRAASLNILSLQLTNSAGSVSTLNSLQVPAARSASSLAAPMAQRAATPPWCAGDSTSRPSPSPSKSPVGRSSHATTAPGEFHRAVVEQLRSLRQLRHGRRSGRGGRGSSSRRSTSNTPGGLSGDDSSPRRGPSDRCSNTTTASEYHADGGDTHGAANGAAFFRKRSKTETEPSLSGVSVKFDLPSGDDSDPDSPSDLSRQCSARARGERSEFLAAPGPRATDDSRLWRQLQDLSPTTRGRSTRRRRTSSSASDPPRAGSDCCSDAGSSPLPPRAASGPRCPAAPSAGEPDLEVQHALLALRAGGEPDIEIQNALLALRAGGVPAASTGCSLDKSACRSPRFYGFGALACCCAGPQPGPPPELAG